MRVISEDRTIDVPYEKSVIYYHSILKEIRARLNDEDYVLKTNVERNEAKNIHLEIIMSYATGRKSYKIPEKG